MKTPLCVKRWGHTSCALLLSTGVLFACESGDSTGPLPPEANTGIAGDGTLAAELEAIRYTLDLPALGGMLLQGGQIVEMAAVGLRAIGHSDQVSPGDRWHIGSLTKAMTATVAGVLVEEGVVNWTTTLEEVFPHLTGDMRPEYRNVRLEELLSHSSGLPSDMTEAPSYSSFRHSPDPLPVQRRLFTAEMLARPGASTRGTYHYSNTGYIVAGCMLEELTGKSWEELMQLYLFGPLGMHATGFGAPGSVHGSPDQPRGHRRQGGHWISETPGLLGDNPAFIGPAGTVHTNFPDYARYMAAHLAGARGHGGMVTAETFQKLHTPVPGLSYAMGWGVGNGSWAGGRFLSHGGSNGLWYAVVLIAPERDFAMFVVTNAGDDDGADGTGAAVDLLIERFDAAAASGR